MSNPLSLLLAPAAAAAAAADVAAAANYCVKRSSRRGGSAWTPSDGSQAYAACVPVRLDPTVATGRDCCAPLTALVRCESASVVYMP